MAIDPELLFAGHETENGYGTGATPPEHYLGAEFIMFHDCEHPTWLQSKEVPMCKLRPPVPAPTNVTEDTTPSAGL